MLRQDDSEDEEEDEEEGELVRMSDEERDKLIFGGVQALLSHLALNCIKACVAKLPVC